jgi:hypothetical protein
VTTQAAIPKGIEKSDDSRTSIGSATRIDMPLPNAAAESAIIARRKTNVLDGPEEADFINCCFYRVKKYGDKTTFDTNPFYSGAVMRGVTLQQQKLHAVLHKKNPALSKQTFLEA